MASSGEDVFREWAASNDASSTMELCRELAQAPRREIDKDLVRKLGRKVRVRYMRDTNVLRALAELYYRAELLEDAQRVLNDLVVKDPDAPEPYELLGRVLTRMGDARRAVVAFDRALDLGIEGTSVRRQREEVQSLIALQESEGTAAAAEKARAVLGADSIAPDVGYDDDDPFGEELERKEEQRSSAPPPEPSRPSVERPPPMSSPPREETRYSLRASGDGSDRPRRATSVTAGKRRSEAARELPSALTGADERREPPSERDVDNEPSASSAAPEDSSSSPVPGDLREPAFPRPPAMPSEDGTKAAPEIDLPISGGVAPSSRPAAKRSPARRPSWALVAGAMIVAAALGGVGFVMFGGTGGSERANPRTQLVGAGVLGTRAAALATLDERLQREGAAPRDLLAVQTLLVLEMGEAPARLRSAIGDARASGLSGESVSFAARILTLFDGDDALRKRAAQLEDKEPASDPLDAFAGAVLASALGHSDIALARLRRSVELEPGFVAAQTRLCRLLLINRAPAEAAGCVAQLAERSRGIGEVLGLQVLLTATDGDARQHLQAVTEATKRQGEIPLELRSLVRAVDALGSVNVEAGKGALSAAVAEETTALGVSYIGYLALGAGHREVAAYAVDRAHKMAGADAPPTLLQGWVLLTGGQLDDAQRLTERLTPDDAAVLKAWMAYENVDAAELAVQMKVPATGTRGEATVLEAARRRLDAKTPFSTPELVELSRGSPLLGNLVAVDAALDAGDIGLARELSARWGPQPAPLRLTRLVRILRYEGRQRAIAPLADQLPPTELGLLEHLMASESKPERAEIMKAAPTRDGRMRDWLRIYRLARDRNFPRALAAAADVGPPSPSAPLPLRVLAGSTYALLSDKKRARTLLEPILESYPRHPDALRAAVDAGLRSPDAL